MKIITGIIFLFLAILISSPAYALKFRCDVKEKSWCESTGCKSADAKGEYNLISFDDKTYSLCSEGKTECQVLEIEYGQKSGIFYIVGFGSGAFIKWATQDEDLILKIKEGEFVEVRTNMLGSMSSFGRCLEIK